MAISTLPGPPHPVSTRCTASRTKAKWKLSTAAWAVPKGRLYVAASIAGRKGVVRIYPDRRADLFLSGPGIVGVAFTPSRSMVVATTNAIHRVDVGIKGRPLF